MKANDCELLDTRVQCQDHPKCYDSTEKWNVKKKMAKKNKIYSLLIKESQ